ncbi:MAG: chemotaxis protein CheW, partial [Candidatus Neomarinimicrobiota bacterium]
MHVSQPDRNQHSTGFRSDGILQLVGFRLGQELFGVDILKVQDINRLMKVTKIPHAPEFVEGVINLRG